ncbi:MAG TPA: 2'-5' RNA ligase family protein [Flavisolibacter sp.]|nr:2'-5' RNA ligase family protein [Flavisolibacter sp.]
MSSSAPLIVTLSLDEQAFSFFNELRKKYFPPERNYLQAHLTLFHHLPAEEPTIFDTIKQTASQYTNFPLAVTGATFIGNGVAYKLESNTLLRMHAALQSAWKDWLTPQDRQRLWPHVTVQNKVSAANARKLYDQLSKVFTPFMAYGTGLSVWAYRGGPWEALATYPFAKVAG